jgi:hypothetical protein
MALKSVGNVAPSGQRGGENNANIFTPDNWYGGADKNARPNMPANSSGSYQWYDSEPFGGVPGGKSGYNPWQGQGWYYTQGVTQQPAPGQLPAYLQGRAPSQATVDSANSSGAAAGKAYGDWKTKQEAGRAALSKGASAGGAYAANQEYLEKSGINASRRASTAQFSGPNSPGAVAAQAEGQY